MTAVMTAFPRAGYTKAMDRYALAFIKASLAYLGLGVLLGLAMVLAPAEYALPYRLLPSHAHVNLLGWVSMMIFGVAYHVLPRFSGRPLYSPGLARTHFWLGNLGLAGMAVFFALNRWQAGRWQVPLGISGMIQGSGMLLFVFNLWKTLSR